MKADAKTEAAILVTLKKFAESYSSLDLSSLLALHAPEAETVIFDMGTRYLGPGEIRALLEYDVASYEAITITFDWVSISSDGMVAWVASHVTFKVTQSGQERTTPAWLTFVFEKRGDAWLIVQGHGSPVTSGLVEG